MAQKPLSQKTIDRFAELYGSGIMTQHEAARAAGMHEATGERILRRPEVRAKVEDARKRSPAALIGDARGVVEELMNATTDTNEPAYYVRAKGAEIMLKFAEQLEAADAAERLDESLPEGVYRVYPRVTG